MKNAFVYYSSYGTFFGLDLCISLYLTLFTHCNVYVLFLFFFLYDTCTSFYVQPKLFKCKAIFVEFT